MNEHDHDELTLALQRETLDHTLFNDEQEQELDDDRDINNPQAQRRLINQRQQGRMQELSRDESGGDLPL